MTKHPPFEEFFADPSQLQPGTSQDRLKAVEKELGLTLPKALKALLLWKDGGLFAEGRFLLFSAGEGIHPEETLVAANTGLPDDYPLLNIGRDSRTDFGFLLSDLSKKKKKKKKEKKRKRGKIAVHAYLHEEGATNEIADSFYEWIASMEELARASSTADS